MKKLKFPVIKEPLPSPKWLSMDDYAGFVTLNLKYNFNRRANRKWRKMQATDVPFSLRRRK